MNPIVTQQTALDNALVAPDNRFWFTISKVKNSTSYQFKLDKKKCRINVEVFRDILYIYPRLPNQEFDEPPSDEEIVSFVKELGYKGDIGSVTEVYTYHMYQPWRTFAAIINKYLSRKTKGLDKIILSRAQILWGMFYRKNVDFVDLIWEDFMFQIDNKDSIKDDSVLGTLKFVAKTEDNQVYGALIPAVMINQKIQNSNSYKTYLAFATGATTPKKARKWKKPDSPSKKQTLVTTKEPTQIPAARSQPTGVQIRDTPSVFMSKKKAPAKADRNKGIDLMSEAALLEEA
ncbi:hypothetical protein Tco_1069180 [Tanacetum coccineum]|uniref:Uncharacterized protein n=1 Tax=Tanacetum coccineum TaxID=301880 RepID=A0ABQ5HHS4_9ASTR